MPTKTKAPVHGLQCEWVGSGSLGREVLLSRWHCSLCGETSELTDWAEADAAFMRHRNEQCREPALKCAYLRCSNKEWGSDLMEEKAQRHFREHPTTDLVNVHEHAGWWLLFTRNPNPREERLVIVGTANDRAVFQEPAASIRKVIFRRGINAVYFAHILER